MVVEKIVTVDRSTGKVLSSTTKTVDGDPAIYTGALAEFFVSILQKREAQK